MEQFLRKIGEKNKGERKKFYFEEDKITDMTYLSSLVDKDITKWKRKEIVKVNKKGFKMNKHIDDVSIYKNSKGHQIKYDKPKYTLYSKKAPIYTMILYMSDSEIDFKGGEFCFIDEEIKPRKGLGIFFESKEVHEVKEIKEGIRKCKVIKFYE